MVQYTDCFDISEADPYIKDVREIEADMGIE